MLFFQSKNGGFDVKTNIINRSVDLSSSEFCAIHTVIPRANVTVTLPDPADVSGRMAWFKIRRDNVNLFTLTLASADIDGETTVRLTDDKDAICIYSVETKYKILGFYATSIRKDEENLSSSSSLSSASSDKSMSESSESSSRSSVSSESSSRSSVSDESSSSTVVDEITMTISDLPSGKTWCGLNNGTHSLDGTETVSQGGHRWLYQNGTEQLKLEATWLLTTSSAAYSNQQWYLQYGGNHAGTLTVYSPANAPYASIGYNGQYTPNGWTATINGVTFTWSKGTDWSRGNM